jgi:hypothetical protein
MINYQINTKDCLIPFGKYKNKTVQDVVNTEPSYLVLMKEKFKNIQFGNKLSKDIDTLEFVIAIDKTLSYKTGDDNYLVTGDVHADYDLGLCGQ